MPLVRPYTPLGVYTRSVVFFLPPSIEMGLSERLHQHRRGAGLLDYVPPRIGPNGLELHVPGANFEGPRTDIKRRLREGVKPTTRTDAAARTHDIQYHNIGVQLATGKITRAEAVNQIRASDNRLLKTAVKAKLSLNPVEHLHSNAAIAGILGKKGLQTVGAMDELAFVGNDDEELEGGRKPKKKDPIKGLRKRFKKMGV